MTLLLHPRQAGANGCHSIDKQLVEEHHCAAARHPMRAVALRAALPRRSEALVVPKARYQRPKRGEDANGAMASAPLAS